MTSGEIIKLGTSLGLAFNSNNFPDMLARDIVVFDGCNGQRFLIDGSWPDEQIYSQIGKSLILQGKRMKAMEIQQVLSVNND